MWREVLSKEGGNTNGQPPELAWTMEDAVRQQAKAVQLYNLKTAAHRESMRRQEVKPRTVASPEKRAAMKRLRKMEKALDAERRSNNMLEEQVKLQCSPVISTMERLRWSEKQPASAQK